MWQRPGYQAATVPGTGSLPEQTAIGAPAPAGPPAGAPVITGTVAPELTTIPEEVCR